MNDSTEAVKKAIAPSWKLNIYDREEMDAWQQAQNHAFELEEARREQARQQHEDWLRVQEQNHEAWVRLQERAIVAWERMATALEALTPSLKQ